MPKYILLGLILLIGWVRGAAYQNYFNHYNTNNGLSQNTVLKIIQDKKGFIWIATKDGLNRFDGVRFRRFGADDMSSNFISTLFEDSRGNIWVGTNNGPLIYHPAYEKIEKIEVSTCKEGVPKEKTPVAFEELEDGRIVMALEKDGLYLYDPDTGSSEKVTASADFKLTDIKKIYRTNEGRIYLGTVSDGLYYTDDNFHMLHSMKEYPGHDYFSGNMISDIKENEGFVYVATDKNGLIRISPQNGEIERIEIIPGGKPQPLLSEMAFDREGNLIIGSENGLYIYNIGKKKITDNFTHNYFEPSSLSDESVLTVLTDSDDGLWVGEYFGGLDYQPKRDIMFEKYDIRKSKENAPAERIRALAHYNEKMLVGSEDKGLFILDPATGEATTVSGIDDKNIKSLDRVGDLLWIGTFGNGVKSKNLKTGEVRSYSLGTGDNSYILSILVSDNGSILAGTMGGLWKLDKDGKEFQKDESLDGEFIYDLFEDADGNLWVATYSNGVYVRKTGETAWHHFFGKEDGGLPSSKVYGITDDRRGNIWAFTQNGATVLKKGEKEFDVSFMGLDKIPGLVYSMVQEIKGNYWLATNTGIYRIDEKSGKIDNYNTLDGLPTNQFNYGAAYTTPNCRIYFGSTEGLLSFHPSDADDDELRFEKPIISEIFINGRRVLPGEKDSPLEKSITETNEITLSSKENNIGLFVSTLKYNQSGNVQLRYRVEGLENEWQTLDPYRGRIRLLNLPSGHFLFQAGIWKDGELISPLLELKIHIRVPLYRSWWAITLYCLAGLLLLFFGLLVYKRYNREVRSRQMEQYKHEKERELFDSKINFFTNVAHEIRTPLTLIKAPLESIFRSGALKENKDAMESLDVVNMNVERLLLLSTQLLDFRRIESGDFKLNRHVNDVKEILEMVLSRFRPTLESSGKRLELSLPLGPVEANVDSDAMNKIFSNLLINAIKYGNSYVKLTLERNDREFILRISNDGRLVKAEMQEEIFSKFSRLDSKEPGVGLGLAYSRGLARKHGGNLSMEDSEEENIFVLRIPIGEISEVEPEEVLPAETDGDNEETETGGARSVLIVEDDPDLLAFLRKIFISAQYRIYGASNAEQALKVLDSHYIDIVVSDVMMPGIDGLELLTRIKNDVNYSHIPVVLLTAKTRMEDKLQGLEAGADAYIEKPFSTDYLLATVNSLLANRERLRVRFESLPLSKLPVKGLSKVDEEFLKKINGIIMANIDSAGFSTDDIINELGVSRTTFYRKIKGLLDLNPNDYIKLQRLKRAVELFQEGHTSVSEVCYMVGFSSPGYFTKCFQKQFGMSPKEYLAGL